MIIQNHPKKYVILTLIMSVVIASVDDEFRTLVTLTTSGFQHVQR